jgi:predicted enzyme related to lactoylglutathione lyase
MATQIALQQVIAVLPASDLDRAHRFYADALQLTPDSTEDGLFL